MRRGCALLAAASLPLFMVACGDDDDDNLETPDLDPGEGSGVPGDEEDE